MSNCNYPTFTDTYYDFLSKLCIVGDDNIGKQILTKKENEQIKNILGSSIVDKHIEIDNINTMCIKIFCINSNDTDQFYFGYYKNSDTFAIVFDKYNLTSFENAKNKWYVDIKPYITYDKLVYLVGLTKVIKWGNDDCVSSEDILKFTTVHNIAYTEISSLNDAELFFKRVALESYKNINAPKNITYGAWSDCIIL